MQRQRVLFVDDDPNILDGLRRSLHRLRREWQMSFHSSPAEALAEVDGLDAAVVVTDWMMPAIDGMEVCRRIRALEDERGGAKFYIILLTGRQEVEAVVEALDCGADDFIRKPFDHRELTARIRVGRRLLKAEAELRIANQDLLHLATTDPLTQLLNRRRAIEVLESELSRVSRGMQELAVLLLDVDHFKQINDTHGHDAGDTVLVNLARRLGSACRPYDSVARWGGEEFLVICPHVSEFDAPGVGERLRRAVSESKVGVHEEGRFEVRVSVGVAVARPGSDWDIRKLVALADHALYRAKDEGRDCVRCAPLEEAPRP